MHSYKLHLDVQVISGQRGWWDDNGDDDYDGDDDGWRDPTSWDLYRSDALPAENVVVCAKSQTKIHIPLQTCCQSCQGSHLWPL